MTLPTTLTKIYNALLRHLPPFFAGKLLLEAHSHAVALARANDSVESMSAELWPDTATASLDRWESVTRVPSRLTDGVAARQARALAVLQRVNGPQLSRLRPMLEGLLSCTDAQLLMLEQLRANIEAALTLTTGAIARALPVTLQLGAPFPGAIDSTGVRVYVSVSALNNTQITVKHADGTTWTFAATQLAGWYENRAAFLGKSPAQPFTITVTDAGGGHTLTEARLLVSNDVDSAQIYYFFAVRDVGLGGTPDYDEAQRQFDRYALGHMATIVAAHSAAIVDEDYSRVEREPVGV